MKFACTKTARHKLARFLKEHTPAPSPEEVVQSQLVELTLGCSNRPGLAADIAAVISQHSHHIEVVVFACSLVASAPVNMHLVKHKSMPVHLWP